MRVLINYSYQYYPFTTASYLEMALHNDKRFKPFRIGENGIPCADLIINVEPYDFVIAYPGRKSCLWEIDNHIQQGKKIHDYEKVDHVFIAQKFFLPLYPDKKTSWLPLAADPEKHRLYSDEPIEYDIGFLGNDTYPRRKGLIEKLEKHFKVLRGNSKPGEEYSRKLSRCRLLFNCSMGNDLNMRVFEAMSIGRLLLTDKVPGIDDLFVDGEHYISYDSWEMLYKQVVYYLEYLKEANEIAQRASNYIKAKHTYQHRLEEILKISGFY